MERKFSWPLFARGIPQPTFRPTFHRSFPPPPSSFWEIDPIPRNREPENRPNSTRTNPQFRGFQTFVSMAKSRLPEKRVIRGEKVGGGGRGGRGARVVVFRRMRCLFRIEIGTTRSLRHSQCLERRGGIEERTKPSSSSSNSSTSSSSNSSSRIRPSRRGRRTRIGQRDGEEREKKRSDQAVS